MKNPRPKFVVHFELIVTFSKRQNKDKVSRRSCSGHGAKRSEQEKQQWGRGRGERDSEGTLPQFPSPFPLSLFFPVLVDVAPYSTSDFKWRGWSNDFWGFEMFHSWIFWVGKFGKNFLVWLDWGRFSFAYSKECEDSRVIPAYPGAYFCEKSTTNFFSENFYDLEIRHGIFWGLIFVQRFFWYLFPGFFLGGLSFSHIRSSPTLEMLSQPPVLQ